MVGRAWFPSREPGRIDVSGAVTPRQRSWAATVGESALEPVETGTRYPRFLKPISEGALVFARDRGASQHRARDRPARRVRTPESL